MGIRNNKVLYNSSAAGSGDWFFLDSRYESDAQRAVMGTVVTGDTVNIEGITLPIRCTESDSLASIDAEDITELGSYTENFSDILNGNWTWIRVTKEGTTGTAKVQGNI